MIDASKISTGINDLREEIEVLEEKLHSNKEKIKAFKPILKEHKDLKDSYKSLMKELRLKRNVLNTISDFIKEPVGEKQLNMFPTQAASVN